MIGVVIGVTIYVGRTLIAEFYTNIEEIIAETDHLF
jgi:Na+-driven multidrug efflux pump